MDKFQRRCGLANDSTIQKYLDPPQRRWIVFSGGISQKGEGCIFDWSRAGIYGDKAGKGHILYQTRISAFWGLCWAIMRDKSICYETVVRRNGCEIIDQFNWSIRNLCDL